MEKIEIVRRNSYWMRHMSTSIAPNKDQALTEERVQDLLRRDRVGWTHGCDGSHVPGSTGRAATDRGVWKSTLELRVSRQFMSQNSRGS